LIIDVREHVIPSDNPASVVEERLPADVDPPEPHDRSGNPDSPRMLDEAALHPRPTLLTWRLLDEDPPKPA
jgi:hypothetical protein